MEGNECGRYPAMKIPNSGYARDVKKPRLYPAHPVRYVAVAVIIAGAIACALGIRSSMAFGGVLPLLVAGVIVLLAGIAVLIMTYAGTNRGSIRA